MSVNWTYMYVHVCIFRHIHISNQYNQRGDMLDYVIWYLCFWWYILLFDLWCWTYGMETSYYAIYGFVLTYYQCQMNDWMTIQMYFSTLYHHNGRMNNNATQIIGSSTVCSTASWYKHQRNTKAPYYCPFMRGIHQWPVNVHDKGSVVRKACPWHGLISWTPLKHDPTPKKPDWNPLSHTNQTHSNM